MQFNQLRFDSDGRMDVKKERKKEFFLFHVLQFQWWGKAGWVFVGFGCTYVSAVFCRSLWKWGRRKRPPQTVMLTSFSCCTFADFLLWHLLGFPTNAVSWFSFKTKLESTVHLFTFKHHNFPHLNSNLLASQFRPKSSFYLPSYTVDVIASGAPPLALPAASAAAADQSGEGAGRALIKKRKERRFPLPPSVVPHEGRRLWVISTAVQKRHEFDISFFSSSVGCFGVIVSTRRLESAYRKEAVELSVNYPQKKSRNLAWR